VAAIRAATGRPLDRIPVRPDDVALPAPATSTPVARVAGVSHR
jgi:hypothetical protein